MLKKFLLRIITLISTILPCPTTKSKVSELDSPQLLMDESRLLIIRLAGAGSATRGSSCMVTRDGKSLSTESLITL